MNIVGENDEILKKLTPAVEKFEEIVNNVTTSQVSFTYYHPKYTNKKISMLEIEAKLLFYNFLKSFYHCINL